MCVCVNASSHESGSVLPLQLLWFSLPHGTIEQKKKSLSQRAHGAEYQSFLKLNSIFLPLLYPFPTLLLLSLSLSLSLSRKMGQVRVHEECSAAAPRASSWCEGLRLRVEGLVSE